MLRTLYKSDLSRIVAIENAVHVAPWAEDTFKTCLQSTCIGWVVEADQKVVGFVMISMSLDECHVLNICVDYPYQRRGYARQLLIKVLNHCKAKKLELVYLEVRRSNAGAIHLYEKLGFQLLGERAGYYPTVAGREDALILAKILSDYTPE